MDADTRLRPLSVLPVPPVPVLIVTFLAGLLIGILTGSGARAGEHGGALPISAFVGEYVGEAELVNADGTRARRDLSVRIRETRNGFSVAWTTTTYKPSGRTKEKSYEIEFRPTERRGIYSAAMRRNVFGHAVPLDPMKGEPFVWGRIVGRTLTVYSLFIDDEGGYELQQYDRTLIDEGLELRFARFRNGERLKSVHAILRRTK